ncbi:MAG: DUF6769 family protein [Bacteroidota bacterium]
MRRKIALFILFFANIILLAHAVLPHHHHETYVCLFDKHSYHDNDSSEEKTFCHHEHHGQNEDSADCLLKNLVVLPAKSIKQAFQSFTYTSDYHHFNDFLLNFDDERSGFLSSSNHFQQFTEESSYLNYVSRCLGLRAPPVV